MTRENGHCARHTYTYLHCARCLLVRSPDPRGFSYLKIFSADAPDAVRRFSLHVLPFFCRQKFIFF